MPVPCARCSMPLLKWELVRGGAAECPSCGAANQVQVFPAALSREAAPRAEAAGEGEATCFDHPGKRAAAVCRHCGRFVCQLCAVEMQDGVSCPSCVVHPRADSKRAAANPSLMLYDSWALLTPFALLLFWPLTILSAPAVLAITVMKWNQPLSPVRRSRWRFLAGLGVALVQGGLWAWFGWYLVAKLRSGA